VAVAALDGALEVLETELGPGAERYPALTPSVPAANWYERVIRDLHGIVPEGHPRLDALVAREARRALPAHVEGDGVFTIPYGPVRSGVFESVEYLIETIGEDIPHLRTRIYHKHRGTASRFTGLEPDVGVLVAERVEGVASVAHASAFCQAIEQLAGVEPPRRALFVRALHAELERVANHLDSMIRHCEGAGQAVAYARLSMHKERVLRLRAELCGSRFGRGVVVPGGVARSPMLGRSEILTALTALERGVRSDLTALMATPSFLDRLRGTGRIDAATARSHGLVGPVGRASGLGEDLRVTRPYGAYRLLDAGPAVTAKDGDALARSQVRIEEIGRSFDLMRQAADELGEGIGERPRDPWAERCEQSQLVRGRAIGAAEAPQGEVLYAVEVEDGRLMSVVPRSASFHNLALFHSAFAGDIFTDFAFIEASFGLSIAGAAL
jgi:formate hydrogenlyase subunit 5